MTTEEIIKFSEEIQVKVAILRHLTELNKHLNIDSEGLKEFADTTSKYSQISRSDLIGFASKWMRAGLNEEILGVQKEIKDIAYRITPEDP